MLGLDVGGSNARGGSNASGGSSAGSPFVPPKCDELTFADSVLEAEVRRQLQKLDGALTTEEGAFIQDITLGSDIASLQGLECLVNLASLNVAGTFPSLQPLRGLPKLRYLHVHSTQLTDIEALSSLPALEKLSLWDALASDAASIHQLPQLQELAILGGATPMNLAAVCTCPKLRDLRLEDINLAQLPELDGCTSLTSLNLARNALGDVSALGQQTQLTSLNLAANKITDLAPLSPLGQLTFLGLSSNQISDFSPLAKLTLLRTVDAISNPSASLAPFVGLANLTNLDLRQTALDCAGEAANLATLEAKLGSLFLHDCP
jgi:internalin A